MESKKKNIKKANLSGFAYIIVIMLIINVISAYLYARIDLTTEKRYTLSETTKDMLRSLDDHVYFKVYLEGDFPAGFKKLRRETKEMLDEFRAYSKFIDYEFINPSASSDKKERDETYKILIERGLAPTDLQVRTKEGTQQQIIFPGALVYYRDRELPIDLLDNQLNAPPETVLNSSAQNLEFKLVESIKKASRLKKPSIAFIEGHGELDKNEEFDISRELGDNFKVERITLDGQLNALCRRSEPDKDGKVIITRNFEAIIIARPLGEYSEKDKFIIDQYIMQGGKVLWLIDAVLTSMDSLQSESTVGVDLKHNLDDQLFKYGLRLNRNLVLDLNSAAIPLRTGQVGNQPQIDFFRWHYFPLLNAASTHPLVRNMNSVKAEFVSSVDTVRAEGIKKTPLLKTSNYSRTVTTPALITLALLREKPDERLYNNPGLNVAWLLEGSFPSLFENRIAPEIADSKEIGFLGKSVPTSMIVVGDGDIIRNQFHIPNGYPLPLGFDQYTRQTYGNKDFILNALSYLVDGPGLVGIRSRELKIRLLDMTRINDSRLQWQLINVALPVLLVVIFGIVLSIARKRRFAR
ncbi:MAG: gliding motility-associated ABC transporter substrate-binding protein GldG [Bacteroidales bacterium]|nr:gliding motility-associated ABC transporter substrate-binding protein GldG [Bacteroidales bacterium]